MRRSKCMSCSGKMQQGGKKYATTMPDISYPHAYNPMDAQLSNPDIATNLGWEKTHQNNGIDPFTAGLGLNALTTGLGYLSGIVDRSRQNQYDYQQQAQLGQMNAMPATDYQPNPYSLYAKHGGRLKNHILHSKSFSNNAQMNMSGDEEPYMQMGGVPMRVTPMDDSYIQIKPQNPYPKDFVQFMLNGPYNKVAESSNGVAFPKSIPQEFSGNLPMMNIIKQVGGSVLGTKNFNDFQYAQDFATRHNTYSDTNLHDVGYMPKFVDEAGNPAKPMATKPLSFNIPNGIQLSDIKSYGNAYWYTDPHTGDIVDVDPAVVNLPRFRKPQVIPTVDSETLATRKQGGKWIQNAINPDHKGWCTPLSNPHCTGRRRAFALMMKKKHGFH